MGRKATGPAGTARLPKVNQRDRITVGFIRRVIRFLISQGDVEMELNKKGFTLIEVLVGLILLAIGLLAIAKMQILSIRGNFFSHYLTQASYVAQDRLEFLDNLPYAQLQAGNYNDGSTTISGVVFNRSYTVVNNPGGYTIINYTVTWNDGVNRSIAFSTIRSL